MLKSSLPVPHGFFTRAGGISKGLFESLNVGVGSSDDKADVTENRKRCAEALGYRAEKLTTPYQIHSAKSVIVDEPVRLEADSYVTKEKGLLLGIVTADCLPVLMWESTGIVGAAHAGWKGAVGGVLDNTIANIISLGGLVENIHAVIGPAISQESYQVQEDFRTAVLSADSVAEVFFAKHESEGYLFDLPNYAKRCLENLGVMNIDILAEDTLSQPQKF